MCNKMSWHTFTTIKKYYILLTIFFTFFLYPFHITILFMMKKKILKNSFMNTFAIVINTTNTITLMDTTPTMNEYMNHTFILSNGLY